MSDAHECDLCGVLYKQEKGVVSLDVRIVREHDLDSWSDVDFCPVCSAKLITLIKPALDDYKEVAS